MTHHPSNEWADQLVQEHLKRFLHQYSWRLDLFDDMPRISSNDELISHFLFCILGGYSITYELNTLAFEAVVSDTGLKRSTLIEQDFERRVAALLKRIPIRTSEGVSYKSYRFPNSKATMFANACLWLHTIHNWDLSFIYQIDPKSARQHLLDCPGVGQKTASWFLRNVGHGAGLAIIDVHVERIAKEWALVPYELTATANYTEIEDRLQRHCMAIGYDLSQVDLAIWKYSRGDIIDWSTGQGLLF